ncbi:MAG TPA: DUF302 domain-containing protein [Gemmatimonadota bacterium]|nr:DUF302 domain-containing protein [Gemmatimonadota bacterium]
MKRTETPYALMREVDMSYEEAERRIREELASQGFGALTEIDVRATLKKKLDVEFPPYVILGACNPSLAHRALAVEPDIGLLLPCNVVVRRDENAGTTIVEAMDPEPMIDLAGNEALAEVAAEARARLETALDRVAAG